MRCGIAKDQHRAWTLERELMAVAIDLPVDRLRVTGVLPLFRRAENRPHTGRRAKAAPVLDVAVAPQARHADNDPVLANDALHHDGVFSITRLWANEKH